jgi:predicted component of type VI protein secretion system
VFASMSPEVRAPRLMREIGVSNAFIAALCHIEQTKLSMAFRQLKDLSNAEGQRLMGTLGRLVEIREAIAPLQIDLKNAANARLVLEAFEGQDAEAIKQKASALFG